MASYFDTDAGEFADRTEVKNSIAYWMFQHVKKKV